MAGECSQRAVSRSRNAAAMIGPLEWLNCGSGARIMRILLVEDEAEMAGALSSALRRYDMVVDHVPTLADAEEAISADVHAAVLLDRQLPDGDGLTLIPKLRARADGVPIIVLTARGELADRIA